MFDNIGYMFECECSIFPMCIKKKDKYDVIVHDCDGCEHQINDVAESNRQYSLEKFRERAKKLGLKELQDGKFVLNNKQ